MNGSRFGRGLGQVSDILAQALFPVPDELGLDARTRNALQRQATMELGLGMMAAKDRGAGLGTGLGVAYQNAQRGLGANLGQIYEAQQGQRQEARQNAIDARLIRADERDIANDAWTHDMRERELAGVEGARAFDQNYRTADLNLRRIESERNRGAQGTWGQPFEAIDPATGKVGMFQSHSLSGQIRPAAVGGKGLGPKPDRGNESGVSAENAIYRQVVGAFGGTFDPVTGSIVGLDKDQASRVQGITARASRAYVDGAGNVTISEAVDRAMQDRINQKPDAAATVALPPAAASRLKEGTVTTFANGQKWTIRDGQPAQVK